MYIVRSRHQKETAKFCPSVSSVSVKKIIVKNLFQLICEHYGSAFEGAHEVQKQFRISMRKTNVSDILCTLLY